MNDLGGRDEHPTRHPPEDTGGMGTTRGTVVAGFLRLLLLMVRLAAALAGAFFLWVVAMYLVRPAAVYEWTRVRLVRLASDAAGLPVDIDSISGPLWREFYLHGVRLRSADRPGAPVFANVQRVTIRPHWLRILIWTGPLATITLEHGYGDVRLDPKGHLNIQPRAGPPGAIHAPYIKLESSNLMLAYWDQNRKFGYRTYWWVSHSQGRVRGNSFQLALDGRSSKQRIRAQVDLNLDSKGGALALSFSAIEPRLLNYMLKLPDIRFLDGSAAGNVRVSWQDASFRKLDYRGATALESARVWVRRLPVPVEDLSSHLLFNMKQLRISDGRLLLLGTPVDFRGHLDDYSGKHARLTLQANSAAVALERLPALIPALGGQGLKGRGNFRAAISGELLDPLVQGVVGIPDTTFQGLKLTAVRAQFRYRTLQLQVPHWQVQTLRGTVQGESRLDLLRQGLFSRLRWNHLGVPETMQYLKVKQIPAYPVSGFLSGQAEIGGPFTQPAVQGAVAIQEGRVGPWRATSARATFRARGKRFALPQLQAVLKGPAAGEHLQLDGQVREEGGLLATIRSQNIPLSRLLGLAPQLRGVSGRFDLNGEIRGAWQIARQDWTSISGRGNLRLRNAVLFEQPVDRADATWVLDRALLQLPSVRAVRHETSLAGSGTIDLRRAMAAQGKLVNMPHLGMRVAGLQHRLGTAAGGLSWGQSLYRSAPYLTIERLQGVVHLRDLPPLRKRTGVQSGRLQLDGKVQADIGGFSFDAEAILTDFVHPRLGLEKVTAELGFDHGRLSLREMLIQQAEDHYRLQGWVDVLGKYRRVDMRGEIIDGHVPTLLSLLPQTYLKEAFEESGVPQIIQRTRPIPMDYQLPDTEEHAQFTDGNFAQLLRADSFSGGAARPRGAARRSQEITALQYHEETSLPPAFARDVPTAPLWWQEADGIVNAQVGIRGELSVPRTDLALHITRGRFLTHNIERLEIRALYQNRQLNLHSAVLQEGPDTLVSASGLVDPSGNTAIDVQAENLDLDWANPWLAPYGLVLGGRSKWTIALEGPWRKPNMLIEADITGGKFGQGESEPVLYDHLSALSRYQDGVLEITQGSVEVGDRRITMSGLIPVTAEGQEFDLVANIKDSGFGLISLFNKDIQWLGGKGQAVVNLKGTRRRPYFVGSVQLDDARVKLGALEDPLEHVNARINLLSEQKKPIGPQLRAAERVDYVSIDRCQAKLNGGDLSVRGTMELLSLRPLYFGMRERVVRAGESAQPPDEQRQYIRIIGKNLVLRQKPLYQGRTDLDLRLRGLVEEPVLLGSIAMSHGALQVGGGSSGTTEGPPGAEGPGIAMRFDRRRPLVVTVGEDLWVRSALGTALVGDMAIQPFGTLTIKGSLQEPRLEGLIELKRGQITILNRRFQVVEGRADFQTVTGVSSRIAGPMAYINPLIQVTIRGKVHNPFAGAAGESNIVLEGKVNGRLQDLQDRDRLRIEWTEKDGLTDSQVLAILARQKEVEQVLGGQIAQSLVRELTPFLSSYLLGPFSSQIEEMTGFDEFSLGAESDPRATQLSNLNIGLSLSLTKTLIQGFSISYTGFFGSRVLNSYSLRYRVLPFLSLVYRMIQEPNELIHSGLVEITRHF